MNNTNFIRKCWQEVGKLNTKKESTVVPRLSLIMAMSTDGRIYFSFTQVNTDSRVFCIFMTKLVEKLTAEEPDWRKNTVLLIDGAKY